MESEDTSVEKVDPDKELKWKEIFYPTPAQNDDQDA